MIIHAIILKFNGIPKMLIKIGNCRLFFNYVFNYFLKTLCKATLPCTNIGKNKMTFW